MQTKFFKNEGPFNISSLLKLLEIENAEIKDFEIEDIKDLISSGSKDVTFFHSKNYLEFAKTTKASFCITNKSLSSYLPKTCTPLIVENVLLSTSLLTSKFYPAAVYDDYDYTVKNITETKFNDKVKFGFNVLVGENVVIGKNCKIGHNSIIEKNVIVGDNCSIASNVIIRNTIVKNNVKILDNCIIGKHGFGFFPSDKGNSRYPHIGIVLIEENCEIGCGATIDRGSMSNTVIGKNTYLDNQIHIAHNVKIGENTIIAGQVGIAGSTTLGKNVRIGGQAGISGHLKIGNNVDIAGGSGVIKDIPDNTKVMGYPAKNLRNFLKNNR